MRDIIWTIIVIWIVWKIYDAFKSISKNKNQEFSRNYDYQTKEGEVRIEKNSNTKSHFNPSDAEFIDYEEIK